MIEFELGLLRVVEACGRVGRRFVIGGSVASMLHGEPRATADVDLVFEAQPADAESVVAAFPEAEWYVPPLEVVRRELRRGERGSFNVLHHATGMKGDLYPAGDDALSRYALDHPVMVQAFGVELPIAPAAYVAARKLRWWDIGRSEKHLRDIRGMLAVSADLLGDDLVRPWLLNEAQRAAWEDCRRRAGEE
jgi:hypothetical protein